MSSKSSSKKLRVGFKASKQDQPKLQPSSKKVLSQSQPKLQPSINGKVTSIEFARFDWKINPLDNMTEVGSSFLLRSPKFSCGEKVGRPSEWYLSIKYSPESQHLHADVSLSRFGDESQKEVYASVTLFIMRSSRRVSYKLGTVSRVFKADQTEIFRHENSACTACGLTTLQFRPIDINMLQTLMVENKLIVRAQMELHAEIPKDELGANASTKESQTTSTKSAKSGKFSPPSTSTVGTLAGGALNSQVNESLAEKPIWERYNEIPNCTLKCGDSYFPVHTTKLSAKSPIFASIFESFKHMTDNFHHSKLATMTIQNIDPPTMEIVLNYIYGGDLDPKIWTQNNSLEIVKKVLIVAEAYQMQELRDLCIMEMCNNMTLKNCAEVAVFARILELKPIFKKYINGFLRKNWGELQKDKKFLETFHASPQAFEFVFSPKMQPQASTASTSTNFHY